MFPVLLQIRVLHPSLAFGKILLHCGRVLWRNEGAGYGPWVGERSEHGQGHRGDECLRDNLGRRVRPIVTGECNLASPENLYKAWGNAGPLLVYGVEGSWQETGGMLEQRREHG